MLVSECWTRIKLSMCVPQIENVIKRSGKENLNESGKVSSNIWVPIDKMRPQAGGRMKECVSHDAEKALV